MTVNPRDIQRGLDQTTKIFHPNFGVESRIPPNAQQHGHCMYQGWTGLRLEGQSSNIQAWEQNPTTFVNSSKGWATAERQKRFLHR